MKDDLYHEDDPIDVGEVAAAEGILALDGILHDTTLVEFLQQMNPTARTLFLHCLAVTKRTETRLDARRADLDRRLSDRIGQIAAKLDKLDEIVYVVRKSFTIGKAIWAPALLVAGVVLGVRLS